MSEAAEGRILTSVEGAVGWITIDNPKKANTLDLDLIHALRDAWLWAEACDDVQVVVLTATGDRHFCAGVNLGLIDDPAAIKSDDAARSFTNRDCAVSKPVLLAVNGAALGAGLGFVTAADVVFAARHATFLDPHVRLGQITGWTGIRLGRRLPAGDFARSLLGAIGLTAERAYELGLVTEILETADDARRAAGELAARIAEHSPTAVRANLALLRKLAWGDADDPLVDEAMAVQAAHFSHPDAVEGLRAFAERRPGQWVPLHSTDTSS